MLHHIAMFQFRDDVPEETIADIAERLRALPSQIDAIRTYQVGRNVGITEGAWDMVVIGGFDDEAGYREYATHPQHLPIVQDVLAAASARAALQTTDLA